MYVCLYVCVIMSYYYNCTRLSGPHQESPPNIIAANSEVLIGTVRFQVSAVDCN